MSLAGNIGGEELGRETSMTKVGIAAFIGDRRRGPDDLVG
jgi:hypothetical protein